MVMCKLKTFRARNFAYVTLADFIVRMAYQMGKTPLLPLYAASLGAGDAFLGIIVSVSTLTGMIFKPFVGILSDRWGRRLWLIVGTAFFVVMPFTYRFVDSPQQLLIVRMLHGGATAIYGPVTLAYVSELMAAHRAESLGWFGMAREGGYILGPAIAGWLLLYGDPVQVFTVIGLMSCVAFVPVLLLSETARAELPGGTGLIEDVKMALQAGVRTPALWMAGGLESIVFVALYAMKAFLPIYALSAGHNVALVGLFFAVQHGVHVLARPFGGRLGDRFGYAGIIAVGMVVIAAALPLLTVADTSAKLLGLSAVFGIGQALIFPTTVALISTQIGFDHLGAGMGLLGTMQNAGKIVGPVLGGALSAWLGYTMMFRVMGVLLLFGAITVWITLCHRQSRKVRGTGAALP